MLLTLSIKQSIRSYDRGVLVQLPSKQEVYIQDLQAETETHAASIKCVKRDLSLGIKQPRYEANHLTQFSTEFKNAWIYASINSYDCMKCTEKFAFSS